MIQQPATPVDLVLLLLPIIVSIFIFQQPISLHQLPMVDLAIPQLQIILYTYFIRHHSTIILKHRLRLRLRPQHLLNLIPVSSIDIQNTP